MTQTATRIPPTKAEELQILDRAIAELGPVSYLGRYLAQSRDEIERDIRCDFEPMIGTPAEALRTAAQTIDHARAEADRIVSEGRARAEKMIEDAAKRIDEVRSHARRQLRAAAETF